jgi:hypothetical protein
MAQVLTVLIATAAGALAQAPPPASTFAASHGNVFAADIPLASEEVLATTPHSYRPAGSVRTVAQLTVPVGAHWVTDVGSGSLTLTVASGALRVALDGGTAWIAHPSGTDALHELTPGTSVVLVARDRLVMHGRGALFTGNFTLDPVVAAVVRVT